MVSAQRAHALFERRGARFMRRNRRADRDVVTTNSWDDFDEAAAAADVAIVFNIAADDPLASTGLAYRPEDTNPATAAYVAARPDRRIGFMSVNPTHPDVWEEVERARELGLVGVKLGANYQEFEPLSEPAMAFYRYCEREGLPILFHQGASPIRHAPLRYTFPLVTDEIAIACPELTPGAGAAATSTDGKPL